jgi:hypothetical protein
MSIISSQLQSQLFSKIAAWEILSYKYVGELWRCTAPPEMRVEIYIHCAYVCVPKTDKHRGFSTFISFWEFLDYFMMRSISKASRVEAILSSRGRTTEVWYVSSSQGYQSHGSYRVQLSSLSAMCDCMLFRCIGNRIRKELPYCFKLLQQSRFFAGQAMCHHITAAINQGQTSSLAEYKAEAMRRKREDKERRMREQEEADARAWLDRFI